VWISAADGSPDTAAVLEQVTEQCHFDVKETNAWLLTRSISSEWLLNFLVVTTVLFH
jgi:hypothetical protein